MSKELIKTAYDTMGTIIPFKGEGMLEKIIEWNKSGNYPYTPIYMEVTDTGIECNAKDIKKFTDDMEAYIEDVVKNALDLEEVKTAKKIASEFGKYINKTRINQTAPFKDIVSEYTEQEKRYPGFNEKLKEKEDAILSREYEKREKSIKEYIDAKIKEDNLDAHLNLDMFKDFIENKKKTNIYTSTGKLVSGFRNAADEVIRVASEPILKAQEIKEKQQQQTAQFELYMGNFETTGDKEKLETNITQLKRFKENAPSLYPDIVESCERSIQNKISLIEANMRADEADKAKKEQENADGIHLKRAEEIQNKLHDMTLTKEQLKEYHAELSDIYVKLTFAKSQGQVKNLGVSVKKRIEDLEARETAEKLRKQKPKTEAEAKQPAFKYVIPGVALEELDNMVMEAGSDAEAIEKFTRIFKQHLEMTGIVKVEEE